MLYRGYRIKTNGKILFVAGLVAVLFFLLVSVVFLTPVASALTENSGVSVTIGSGAQPPGPPAPGPTTGAVTMAGKAYPRAFMVMYQDGAVAATFLANADGTFSHTISGVQPGIHSFGIYAEDKVGRKSPTLSLSINIMVGTTTKIENLFMPPTIETPAQAEQGPATVLLGSTFPNANIFLFIEPGGVVKQIRANAQGNWQYSLATSGLGIGSYTARARAITDQGEQSEFSLEVQFQITKEPSLPEEPPVEPREGFLCPNGDLNGDGKVNIVDVSIWIYYLNTSDSCADQNGDGIVDIIDLSIIIYWWTDRI